MVHYKLYYFDLRGLAEPIRLLLNYVGQEFDDVRISREQWPQKKEGKQALYIHSLLIEVIKLNATVIDIPEFFYGKVPVLEVDNGKQLNQSATIARFIAEKFNLAGKDEWERAKVNEIVDFQKDVYSELAPYFYVALGFRVGDKDQLREDVYEPGVARLLPMYEKLLKQAGFGFFAPSGLTYVDFMVADYLNTFQQRVESELLKDYPDVDAFVKRVHTLPQLQNYMASRPAQ